MIVQWCCKGIAKIPAENVHRMLVNEIGLQCRDWLNMPPGEPYPYGNALGRLTEENLYLHVNNYSQPDPKTGRPFHETTPFISLSAGCVERQALAESNKTHTALRTALEFATTDFTLPQRPRCPGWVIFCYVLVSTNKAVGIQSVAEEIRDVNHARPFSKWHAQGEVAAKIYVPSAQILSAVRWEPSGPERLEPTNMLLNPKFIHPAALLDERNML